MKRTFYVCECSSLEHIFAVSADEEDLFIEVHLAPLPFWKRVKNAIRYVFGKKSRYGDFDEVLLSPSTALDLGDQLVHWASGQSSAFTANDVH